MTTTTSPDPSMMARPAANAASAHQRNCETCAATIHAKAEICPSCGVRQRTPVSKAALLLLTFFLGGIGAHKFYLGKYWQGALYLVFCWTYIPALAALVEFVIYAFTSSERLDEKYPGAKGSTAVIVVVAAFGSIFVIGILAAIALPAYQDYTKRAKVVEGIRMGDALRLRIAEAYDQRAPDLSCSPEACRLYGAAPGSTKYVKRMSSDRTGAILLEYDEQSFPGAKNRLSIIPLVDGRPADLSDPANAGKTLTWKCGQDALTTIAARYLPSSCK